MKPRINTKKWNTDDTDGADYHRLDSTSNDLSGRNKMKTEV